MKDINWLDEVPLGVEGQAAFDPTDIDKLPAQERIWATIRNAVIQAYAEGYHDRMKEQSEFKF